MKLVKRVIKKAEEGFKYPTVGEMLNYIKDNDIPRNATIVVEHVHDYYLLKQGWAYYETAGDYTKDQYILHPVHNGFGSIEDKKFFALWMHY